MAFWKSSTSGSGKTPREDPQQYVLRREYKKAIELYRAQLKENDQDANTHLRLADALVLDGQKAQAVDEYKRAARTYADLGFLLKAIGVNKKIVKLDPSQEDVHDRLSDLYAERGLLAPQRTPDSTPAAASAVIRPAVEDVPSDISVDEIANALADMPEASSDEFRALQALENELSGLEGLDGLDIEPDAQAQSQFSYQKTPLFSDFKPDEFVHVVKQMSQETFNAGDPIVTEGEPGDALFVIVTGSVKVTTRARGKELQLAILKDGDFFGEGSLITGKPRTATVSAVSETDALKLDRAGFDDVVARYPRVKDVLVRFYQARAESTVQSILKSTRS